MHKRHILDRVPQQYKAEFLNEYTRLIKKRVRLLCILMVAGYILLALSSFALFPEDFKAQEIPATILLVLGGAAILYFNRNAKTLSGAKINAYFFVGLLLAVLTKVNSVYYEYAESEMFLYTFVLLITSFAIPWLSKEIIPIALMDFAAYSAFYAYLNTPYILSTGKVVFNFTDYIEHLIFGVAIFVMCIIIRRKESEREVENFVLLKDVEAKNAQMRKELELATQLHKTLLPKSVSNELVDIAVMYQPATYLGGDYAKFHFIDNERVIFLISDVTGHGVSAALLVNRLHAEVEPLLKEGTEPGPLLKKLNKEILEDFEGTNMYISAFCGLLDFKKMKFIYSNHGHPPQYFYRIRESRIIPLDPQAALLGLSVSESGACERSIDFGKGDKILLFTDGVIEAANASGEEYGKNRLEDFMQKNNLLPPDIFNRELMAELRAFRGGRFEDDIFILTIEIKK